MIWESEPQRKSQSSEMVSSASNAQTSTFRSEYQASNQTGNYFLRNGASLFSRVFSNLMRSKKPEDISGTGLMKYKEVIKDKRSSSRVMEVLW